MNSEVVEKDTNPIDIKRLLKGMGIVDPPSEYIGRISDGYHTFDELYEHRCILFLHLLKSHANNDRKGWWSKNHNDGTSYEGWVIAGTFMGEDLLPITYHLPDKWIPNLGKYAMEFDKAPEWDGHTSKDVIERLLLEL